jgi:hopanoid-associated phosphorylase
VNARTRILVVTGAAFEARIAEGDGIDVLCSGADAAKLRALLHRLDPAGYCAALSFGLAGGLDPTLRAGELIVATEVAAPSGTTHQTTSAITQALAAALGSASAQAQRLAGSDTAVTDPRGKADLFARTQACAVDMESHVVAEFAQAHGLPWGVLRAICDPAHRALPPLALTALRPDGGIDLAAVLKGVVSDPAQIPALIALGRDTKAATAALRRAHRLLGPRFGFLDLLGLVGADLG